MFSSIQTKVLELEAKLNPAGQKLQELESKLENQVATLKANEKFLSNLVLTGHSGIIHEYFPFVL
jgi:hypothetical protein